jgi:prephenate dehydrogenase
MRRVAILGLGLMGGSLGLALKRAGAALEVYGYARRAATRRAALARGAVDRVFDRPDAAVAGADLAVLCVPVLTIGELLRVCRTHFAPECVVTDVGSTKAEVVADARRALQGTAATFIGSHPMAGSDESGIEAARESLYERAVVIVTPADVRERRSAAARKVAGFWRHVGGRVVVLAPREHDRLIARTSHLPHVVAAALVATLYRDGAAARALCGAGFLDTTRIAGGSDLMWHDIIKTNRRAISRELTAFGRELDGLRRMIDRGNFEAVRGFLARSRARRQAMEGSRP